MDDLRRILKAVLESHEDCNDGTGAICSACAIARAELARAPSEEATPARCDAVYCGHRCELAAGHETGGVHVWRAPDGTESGWLSIEHAPASAPSGEAAPTDEEWTDEECAHRFGKTPDEVIAENREVEKAARRVVRNTSTPEARAFWAAADAVAAEVATWPRWRRAMVWPHQDSPVPASAPSAPRCKSDGTDLGRATCDCPEHAPSAAPRDAPCTCVWTADFHDHGEAMIGPHHAAKCPRYAPSATRCEKPPAICEAFVGDGPCDLCASPASPSAAPREPEFTTQHNRKEQHDGHEDLQGDVRGEVERQQRVERRLGERGGEGRGGGDPQGQEVRPLAEPAEGRGGAGDEGGRVPAAERERGGGRVDLVAPREQGTVPYEVRDAISDYRSALATVFFDTTPAAVGNRLDRKARADLESAILAFGAEQRRKGLEEAAEWFDGDDEPGAARVCRSLAAESAEDKP